MAAKRERCRNRNQGFTYMEVIVAIIILSIALIPAIGAIRESVSVSRGQEKLVTDAYALYAMMETTLAQPYDTLAAAAAAVGSATIPTSLSDPVGTPDRRLVYLASYDGDNADSDNNPFTGGDAHLLWVRVELPGEQLSVESLISRF